MLQALNVNPTPPSGQALASSSSNREDFDADEDMEDTEACELNERLKKVCKHDCVASHT